VILAAGEATRMGLPKPALPYASTTMVDTVVSAANSAGLSPVVVVTGFHSAAVSDAVGSGASVVHNPDPNSGNVSSLLVGMEACGDTYGVILLLGDMPGVRGEVIARLADAMTDSASTVGWVEYRDGRGHPIALGRAAFESVRSLHGSKALWPFLSAVPSDDACIIEVDEPRPVDVNTPEDYERITQ
jgi:CTP:molybdopterin cytidylyltransferase MocA